MNLKQLTLLTLVLASLALAQRQLSYPGPMDESSPPPHYTLRSKYQTLGYLSKRCDVGGVADVIEEGHSAEYGIDYLKLRVVEAHYGSTNGQELIVEKADLRDSFYSETMTFEFYPTNLSRIVFNVYSNEYWSFPLRLFPGPEDISEEDMTITKTTPYYQFRNSRRSWWYLDYQGGEPYAFWTNAVQFIRLEPNWTNYYELARSGASSVSNRVKEDSFNDMKNLTWYATDEQLQMMSDDPLFPAVYKDFLESELEKREFEKNPRPLTPEEEKEMKLILFGIIDDEEEGD